jgi:serine/threonine protein phosphatase PrpC
MRTCSVYSSPGLRPQNEDTVYAEGNVFMVADGLGGHSDGKVASELAVRTLSLILCNEDPAVFVIGGQRMEEGELMEAFLMDAIRQAGAVVLQEARKRGSDMATTITAVILRGETAYCAHVGDCALFVSEDGSLPPVRRTMEHRRGASLNRTLGSTEQITPDVIVFHPHLQGLFLVVCDGFWEHVEGPEITKIIEETPDYLLAERLGQAALKNGSPDNVSVIAVIGEGFTSSHAVRQVNCERAWLDRMPASAEKSSRMDALRVFANNNGVAFSNPLEEENQALQAEIIRLNAVIEEMKQGIEKQKADHQHLEDRLNQLNSSSWKLRDVTILLFRHIESLKKLYPREIANALTKQELDRLEAIYQTLLKQNPSRK